MNWVLIGVSRDAEEDADVSKSLPNSPNFEPKSPHRVPQNWSLSDMLQPLPLVNEELWFPAEGYNGGNVRCRSDRTGMNSKSRGVPTSSKTSTYRHRKGYPQDANGEKVHDNIRLHQRWFHFSSFISMKKLGKQLFQVSYMILSMVVNEEEV